MIHFDFGLFLSISRSPAGSRSADSSSSSALLGKVKAAKRPISVTITIIIVGSGLSSSATNGAKIVRPRHTKLQIPMPVALFRSGKVLVSE